MELHEDPVHRLEQQLKALKAEAERLDRELKEAQQQLRRLEIGPAAGEHSGDDLDKD
jgi:hypothetical protein